MADHAKKFVHQHDPDNDGHIDESLKTLFHIMKDMLKEARRKFLSTIAAMKGMTLRKARLAQGQDQTKISVREWTAARTYAKFPEPGEDYPEIMKRKFFQNHLKL